MKQKAMYMNDWIVKLNQFLTLNEQEVLVHSGKISASQAKKYVTQEYQIYKKRLQNTQVDEFDKVIKKLNRINKK